MGLGSTKAFVLCGSRRPLRSGGPCRGYSSLPDDAMRRPRSAGLKGAQGLDHQSMRLRTSTDSIGASVARSNSELHLHVGVAVPSMAPSALAHPACWRHRGSFRIVGVAAPREVGRHVQVGATAGGGVMAALAQALGQRLAVERIGDQAAQPAVGAEQRGAGWLAPWRPLWPSLLARMPTR